MKYMVSRIVKPPTSKAGILITGCVRTRNLYLPSFEGNKRFLPLQSRCTVPNDADVQDRGFWGIKRH